MAQLIGPVSSSADAANLLGATHEQIAGRRASGTIVAIETSDGAWVYPTFQFANGRVHPLVLEVLAIFTAASPPAWTLASWFMAPDTDLLAGRSPAECLHPPISVPEVIELAHQTAARWRS